MMVLTTRGRRALACIALSTALTVPITASAAPQTYVYAVTHSVYGAVGDFTYVASEADGLRRAENRLNVVVKILGLTLHRESSVQVETWRGDRLISFQGQTTSKGRRTLISGAASGDRFVVTTPEGTETGPADVLGTDPWSLTRTGPGTIVSLRTGKITPVRVTGGETETLALNGAPEPVRHFHVNTAAQADKWEVWINGKGVPVKYRSLEGSGAVTFTLKP